MKINPIPKQAAMALSAMLLVSAASATAQTLVNPAYWVGGTADFNNQSFWQTTSSSAPGSSDAVYIGSANPNCANDNGSNNVVLIQPGDPVWQHGDTLAGNENNTTGAYLQTGSTNDTGGGNWLRMAVATGSYGSYILSNGVVNVGGQTHIGEYGTGYLEIDGGVFNTAADPFCVGDGDFGPSPVGYMVMNGGTNNTASEFWIGEGNANNHGTGYVTMNGGTMNIGWWWDIGRWGANGYLTMNGGTINETGTGNAQWGAYNNGVASSATVNMTGGNINILDNDNLEMGNGGNGTVGGTCLFNQSGGTVHVTGQYWVATDNISAVTTNNISGNAVLIVDNWLAVGRNGGQGTMNISGNASITVSATAAANGGNITLSGDAGNTSQGTINQNGGTLTNTATQTWVAENYNGYWNLNSGADVLGVVHLTQNAGAVGIFNLNGGDLTATEITDNNGANGGTGTLNLNGGTLHAGASTTTFIHDINGGVNVQAGGAIINTEGYDVTIAQTLSDGGGNLTKEGAGTLTLSGANYYSGSTIVNAGTLATTTASFANGAYTVADNAGLGVMVTYLNAQVYPQSVTLGTSAGASLNFDLGAFGNPQSAPLAVGGNLALNGTITVNVADAAPTIGEFPLLSYSSLSGSGKFALGSLPAGVTASLVSTANGLDLNITGVALDVWSGAANNNWDINTSLNWINFGSGSPTVYEDGDQVRFDDTVTGSTTVDLITNVVPGGNVVFNNSLTNYTLTGNGSINGLIGLTISGNNSVTVLNTNNYTGATILNAGTLIVTNLANGGLPSAIGAATSATNNLVFNGGTLSYGGPALTWNRGFTLTGNYGVNGGAGTNLATLDVENNMTLTGPMFAGQNSSFVKSGPGTLTYAGTGTNQLSGGNDPGYQVTAGTLVFDGSAGPQVNHNQSEFYIGDTTNSGANIILTNTTLNVDSWFCLSRGNGASGYVCNGNFYNSTLNCGNLSLGYYNGRANLNSVVLTITNSTIHDGGNFNVAESDGTVGTVNITGNSLVTAGSGGPMLMGLSVGATGTVMVADNCIVTNNAWLSCGANGYGTLILTNNAQYYEGSDFNFGDYGGAATTGNLLMSDNAYVKMIGSGNGVYVGKTVGAFGYVTQTSGMIDARLAGYWQLGQSTNAYGQWIQTGGTNLAGGYVSIGRGGDSTSTGLYVISGGLFDQTGTGNGLIVGEQGTGTLNISNSATVVSEANAASFGIGVAIGWTNTGVGTLNLDGGTLVANFIQGGTGSSTLNLNGGVLQAGPNASLNFMTNITSVYLYNSTTIDTSSNNIAINSAIYDGGVGGNLIKAGSGTLFLDGTSFYSGATTIAAGTLGGIGSISKLAVQAGGSVAPGDGGIGLFSVTGTATLAAGSSTSMALNRTNATTSSQLSVSGGLSYNGTLVLKNIGGQLVAGDTFTLFPIAGTGAFSSVQSLTPGQTVTWDTSQLTVNGTVKVATAVPATPPTITTTVTTGAGGSTLNIAWPASYTGIYTLQMQTNSLNVGLGSNWVTVPGSSTTNMIAVPINPTTGAAFYRLVQQ